MTCLIFGIKLRDLLTVFEKTIIFFAISLRKSKNRTVLLLGSTAKCIREHEIVKHARQQFSFGQLTVCLKKPSMFIGLVGNHQFSKFERNIPQMF